MGGVRVVKLIEIMERTSILRVYLGEGGVGKVVPFLFRCMLLMGVGFMESDALGVLIDVGRDVFGGSFEGRYSRVYSFLYEVSVDDVPAVDFELLVVDVDAHIRPFNH